MQDVTSRDLILGYVAALGVCLRALQATTEEISRTNVSEPLTALSTSGDRSREGSINGVGSFKLHGIGCRFEMESGEEVDFDWNPEGRPTFDAFRVFAYGRSRGLEDIAPEAQVSKALELLQHDGFLRVDREGHYYVAEA